MVRILTECEVISVPVWVQDIHSFRRWTDCDDCPHQYRLGWVNGDVWIDISRQEVFTHVLVKTELGIRLGRRTTDAKLGVYLGSGVLLSNIAADISGNPDGTFISYQTLRSGGVRLIEGNRGGFAEIEGLPDMVLEVVSASSEKKDYDLLRQAYWKAGIREYWLVDARKTPPKFEVLRHGPRGYVAVRTQDGWVKSTVFGQSFRLTQTQDKLGHPEFTLSVC